MVSVPFRGYVVVIKRRTKEMIKGYVFPSPFGVM